MVEDTETRTKGSRKGKNTQVWVDNDATNKNELEAIDNEANKDTNSDSDFDDDVIKEYLTFNQVWRKIENSLTNEATKMSHRLALISQLNDIKMFHLDARKLIQEIQSIQTESSLLGKPFANDTLFSALQKCTIWHPVYKETVATVHQINFNTLTTALSIQQTTVESIPAQKIDPRQASARTAGNDDQNKQARETEAKANNSHIITTRSKVLEAAAIGDASISTDYGEISLQNVLYVKHLNVNLLSTNSLMDERAQVILDTTSGQIFLTNGMTLKIAKNCKQGLLEFRGDTWQESMMATSTPLFEGVDEEFKHIKNELKVSKQQLWHECLRHPGRDKAKAITSKLKDKHTMELDPNTTLTLHMIQEHKHLDGARVHMHVGAG
ncbi:uncharacterized protein UHOR_14151 [Ustilago hordei]|uniref:Retrovirus-related Pol polyprotein from transposon TNT 1-94-like beta-barrel domain-containing protein n=1 Tax=Ustilago hordei TaxID=120017 RepID=I2FSX2_USTHO|nr:uncharacterized protein UHOR_14151 [Ustilago hordei]